MKISTNKCSRQEIGDNRVLFLLSLSLSLSLIVPPVQIKSVVIMARNSFDGELFLWL